MDVYATIQCRDFSCADVQTAAYDRRPLEVDPEAIRMVLISEAAPADPQDGYYARPGSLFEQTTLLAFADAGLEVQSIQELLDRGIYLTNAVKCAKTSYNLPTPVVQACSHLLEQELALFPNVQVYLLMGDVAIKAVNAIAKRQGQPRVIPAGSTYKLRGGKFFFRAQRAFPSYLQAGPSFFIEKSKRRTIAEDLRQALSLLEH